jgi:hypothetical protein
VFFFLPSRPQTSRYITEDERTLALTRLNRKNLGEGHTGIDYRAVMRALLDWKTYVVSVIYSCMNLVRPPDFVVSTSTDQLIHLIARDWDQ